ncbi:MAG: ATP-dependent Clp protease ATP-binding subunit [Clostridia bacterium]|nr:ATP-dependent Clp protease ATP-binding subunit [Clostridia bacterium]
MLCSRCKKRAAVVFITKLEGDNRTNEGLCLVCAKELGIPQVNDIISKMGISDEDLDTMSEQITEMMGGIENGEGDGFTFGGPTTLPPMIQNMFAPPQKDGEGLSKPRERRSGSAKTEKQPSKEDKRKAVNMYCTDYTKKAREGGFDKIIGRDREIGRMIQILSRRTKNNPCLIGEPGVGKTAIVEGLAQRIVAGEVPQILRNKEVFLLDLTSLVAGTQFRGQFEGRVKALIEEVKADGNIILFIDEVHNLVGAGDAAEGSMNAANLMKPALSRGEVQVIGATTLTEYRKHIEKDAALERRFQPIVVGEPSVEETVSVLCGLKGYYELFHGVSVDDVLIRRAVELSERYITDRFLPDKAIDLLDEAAACASLRSSALQEYRHCLQQLTDLRAELERVENEPETENEDERVKKYESIATLQSKIMQLQQQADALEPEAKNAKVTGDDLAKVIELWTGIEAGRVAEGDLAKLAQLESNLKARVIGQDQAVEALSRAMRRSRMRLYEKNRPASFIFAGPTGVGKTELVKVLAACLFDTPDNMIRIDMSEYMEKHAVSRLIGSPPGYVGYDEAGQLTERVRRKPYSVVLFDEIEKAHPDIMHILLQILDDGRITDSQGRVVDFSNTVIVMTTNAGSESQGSALGFGKSVSEASEEKTRKALSQFLRPEFLGRVDEIVVFAPLSEETLAGIARLMLSDMRDSVAKQGVTLKWTDEVCELLARVSAGGKYGARELRTNIRKLVEDKIGDTVVLHGSKMPSAIDLAVGDGVITVTAY